MTEQQLDKKNISDLNKSEIDLVEIFYSIIRIRKKLYKSAVVGLIIGIIVALSIPKEYTVKITLSPEMGSSKDGNGLAGLAASFLGNGSTMGDGTDALNASLSTDIVASTPFLLEVLNMDILVSNEGDKMSLESYLDEQSFPWWSYIWGLPGMLVSSVKGLFTEEEKELLDERKHGAIELTKKQYNKINQLKNKIVANIDKKTAITSISVTLQSPRVTAVVADSVVHKLQEYITDYRTSKTKEDCAYLEKLFKERQSEYYIAQKKYAEYIDTHDNLILQSVRTEQERLQNDMSLAYQIYSQVANQLQVARAKVQEEKPVFAIVEPAVIPMKTSGLGVKMYVFIFMFLAVLGTIVWILLGQKAWKRLREEMVNTKNE